MKERYSIDLVDIKMPLIGFLLLHFLRFTTLILLGMLLLIPFLNLWLIRGKDLQSMIEERILLEK